MLEIRLDLDHAATRYVAELVFERWLGLPVLWTHAASCEVTVALDEEPEGRKVTFGGVAEPAAAPAVAQLAHLGTYAARLNAGEDRLIDVGGLSDSLDRRGLSVIFWLVSGAEETSNVLRDEHGRFPSNASSLSRLGLLEVPMADLIAEYIFDRLIGQWPNLPHRRRRGVVVPTHDVDVPFKHAFQRPISLLRNVVGDVVHGRKSLTSVGRTLSDWFRIQKGDSAHDPFNCFDRMMRISEARGLQSTFYFIAGHTGGRIDGDYEIDHPLVRDLIRRICDRGHLIGLHPSYHAAMQVDLLVNERTRLQDVCEQVGHKQVIDLVRTHYLRFDPELTPAILEGAGFRQDSSLAFADAAGFRRSTCNAFPLWDPTSGRPLAIVEQPLIAMEVSLLARRYKAHTRQEAALTLSKLRSACARFGGNFVLLWHNSSFESEADFQLYESAIRALA